ASGVGGSQHRSSSRKDLQAGRPPLGDSVLGNVQRVQRGQLAALSGQPAVIAVWSGADRGAETAPAARVPLGFLTRRIDRKARKGRKADGNRPQRTQRPQSCEAATMAASRGGGRRRASRSDATPADSGPGMNASE